MVGRPDVDRRAQPRAPEASRSERATRSEPRDLRKLERSAEQQQATSPRLQRLQARAERGRLGRQEQRELRRLQQAEQQQKSATERLQQSQTRPQSARLNRNEQRELQRLERSEQQQKSVAQRLERLQNRASSGRLGRAEQRELDRLQRLQQALGMAREPAAARTRVTPQQATAGRFTAGLDTRVDDRRDWRLRHQAPRAVWRLGLHASFVPWVSAVYWPYAYTDVFYYTFWPDAYEDGYWAYAYDGFFDGIYFPYGAPHLDYAYAGPYGEYGVTTGIASPRQRPTPGRITPMAQAICAKPDQGIAAWPINDIARAIGPSPEQRRLLDDLKKAADLAADDFAKACPASVPMTPPGRLEAMIVRLQATLQAVRTVRPALEAFYASLSDEQKARFNEIRPKLKEERTATAQPREGGDSCGGQKAGLSTLPIDEINRAVRPNTAQARTLAQLDRANQKAVDILNAACPTSTAETPTGRLQAMQARLEAMIAAANTVRPALQDFYAALNDEQKAKFNRLGPEGARAG